MGNISHNTELMNDWSARVNDSSNNYDELISRLYGLVDQFVGSPEFSGGLSADFEEKVISLRPVFERYSETFRECTDFINERVAVIESDEAELKSAINSANPLG